VVSILKNSITFLNKRTFPTNNLGKMATNRDLLKEAIADAKAVKETAIANAKAALEEAFTPQLKSMFAAKLQEMELDEEEKDLEEAGFGSMDPVGHGNIKDESSLYEEDLDEYAELQPTDLPKGTRGIEKDEDMMEIDLEELLRELEMEEGDMKDLYEAEGDDDDDTNVSDENSDEGDEEGTPIDLEDMTDEDLKTMIEDVIKDMITAGEIEAGHEGMKDEVGVEMKDEEDVDLAELLKEIKEMEDKKMYEEKEPIDENLIDILMGNDGLASFEVGKVVLTTLIGIASGLVANAYRKYKKDERLKTMKDSEVAKIAAADTSFDNSPEGKEAEKAVQQALKNPSSVEERSSEELAEAYKTIKTLKSELNEINLLNAKLLYTNKIFKSKNLNESQKVKVLSSFDKATTVGEVKLVFETLNEGIKVKPNLIKENLGRASKGTVTPNVKKPIVESNDAFLRMQKLAGII
jgi:hypothetical protein